MAQSRFNPIGRVGAKTPGSGRQKGTCNTRTREIAEKEIMQGITPLEVMVRTMRGEWAAAEAAQDEKEARTLRRSACEIAERAAPFMHARLATTTIEHKDAFSSLTDGQLAALLALAAGHDALDAGGTPAGGAGEAEPGEPATGLSALH